MFTIDVMSRTPVYEQLSTQLERFVLTGMLRGGDQIPSVRALSIELSVNPNTILKAYTELGQRGVLQAVPGKGYFICPDARETLCRLEREKLGELTRLGGEVALAGIPLEEALDAVRGGYTQHPRNDAAQNDMKGVSDRL